MYVIQPDVNERYVVLGTPRVAEHLQRETAGKRRLYDDVFAIRDRGSDTRYDEPSCGDRIMDIRRDAIPVGIEQQEIRRERDA